MIYPENKTQTEKIYDDIVLKGFACSIDNVDIKDENITNITFKLNLNICTYDREEKEDIHVCGLSTKQDDWFKLLGFNYEPTDKDMKRFGFYFSYDNHWESGDHDKPITGKAYFDPDIRVL